MCRIFDEIISSMNFLKLILATGVIGKYKIPISGNIAGFFHFCHTTVHVGFANQYLCVDSITSAVMSTDGKADMTGQ